MPEVDGISLAQETKEKYPQVKIIFISGFSGENYDKNMIHKLNARFLSKPFVMEELIEYIHEISDD